mgnify:CR=1 FL=1
MGSGIYRCLADTVESWIVRMCYYYRKSEIESGQKLANHYASIRFFLHAQVNKPKSYLYSDQKSFKSCKWHSQNQSSKSSLNLIWNLPEKVEFQSLSMKLKSVINLIDLSLFLYLRKAFDIQIQNKDKLSIKQQ